jgi:hypothetical protein
MDYIKELDVRLDKEYFYAGEVLCGKVILDTTENFKLKCEYNCFYFKQQSSFYDDSENDL